MCFSLFHLIFFFRIWQRERFHFGHTSGVQSIQTLLGLFKDDYRLNASNYNYDRTFRENKAGPQSTNVILALYSCDTNLSWTNKAPPGVKWPDSLEAFMIQLLVKELPGVFPFCDAHLCVYNKVR